MLKKCVMLILVLGVVSACATGPTGPSVMVLPGAAGPPAASSSGLRSKACSGGAPRAAATPARERD
jgi:hypothetical protein